MHFPREPGFKVAWGLTYCTLLCGNALGNMPENTFPRELGFKVAYGLTYCTLYTALTSSGSVEIGCVDATMYLAIYQCVGRLVFVHAGHDRVW